jgi:hypothetical protein
MDKAVTIGAVATYDIHDEDDMASDDNRGLPTQQSVKAYADTKAAETRANVQELTESGAVTPGVNAIELNHISTAIEATIADLADHPGMLVVKNTSASGTAAHTVTAAAGTFDGTNDELTLNAGDECIVFWIDSAGNGTIIENVDEVALATAT